MLTPGAYLIALRIVLAAAGCAVAAVLLGLVVSPDGVEGVGVRVAALYALTLLCFAGLPRMRRDDLAGAVAGLACLAEAGHAVLLHHVSPVPLVADLIGVFAAWAPAAVEQYRRLAREARYVTFRDLAVADRRRGRNAPAAAAPTVVRTLATR